jgi:hypothetical protein
MPLPFLTRELFDAIIIIIIIAGLILATRRFYGDMTRPLPDDDTDPRKPSA